MVIRDVIAGKDEATASLVTPYKATVSLVDCSWLSHNGAANCTVICTCGLGRYIVCFSVATLASAVSLFYRLKLYIKQFRKRRGDADKMWVTMLVGFSAQQQKIVKMHSKLQENKLVRLLSLEVQPVCIPMHVACLCRTARSCGSISCLPFSKMFPC